MLGRGLFDLMLAIGLIFCMGFARTTRAVALAERQKLYVDAARVAGLRTPAILFRQVLPNLAGALIVQGSVFLASAIMVESALSFLGIGLESDTPTWGAMLSNAAANTQQPFLAFPPGLAIVSRCWRSTCVGDGHRRRHDRQCPSRPQARRRARSRRTGATAASRPRAHWIADREPSWSSGDVTVAPGRLGGPARWCSDVSLAHRPRRGRRAARRVRVGEVDARPRRRSACCLPASAWRPGRSWFEGRRIDDLDERGLREIRGRGMAVVLQDPMSALSPVHTIGRQLAEPLRAHFGLTGARPRANGRSSCWTASVSRTRSAGSTTIPTSSPAAWRSAWRSRWRWRPARGC